MGSEVPVSSQPSTAVDADRLVAVTFRVPPGFARHAQLVAEFTSWTPLAMDRLRDGSHVVRVLLPASRAWGFQYVLDDATSIDDPAATEQRMEPGLGRVSVVRT